MDEEQLDELEMHLAAGTDLATAMAAVERDEPPQGRDNSAAYAIGIVALLFILGWLCLK